MKKYKLTDETSLCCGRTLHRIVALCDFGNVKKGDKGGWIEKEENLSQNGSCWVYGNAQVCDNAIVRDYAKVFDNVIIRDNSEVYGNSEVGGNIVIGGSTEISCVINILAGAKFYNVKISSTKDYIVFKNWWSSGRYFTWTRSNNMWSVGCFYGTGDELIKKAYADSEDKGKHYEEIVEYVNKCVLKNK